MEILFRGTPPSERQYLGHCRHCNSRIKFKQSEGTIAYDQRDGDCIHIECPVCQQRMYVDLNSYIKPEPAPSWKDI